MKKFEVISEFSPKGDQPNAIKKLKNGISSGKTFQTLKGITGSGKSATIAWLIEQTQLPSLVLAPNKALAAQLANEFKQFFPNNRVEYFVSYYDYYQPEAYVPRSDTFIEKDATINEEIDRLRHSATSALLLRDDVIVVSSVSCIYGLGSPIEYKNKLIPIIKGEDFDIEELLIKLVKQQYIRNDLVVDRGNFRLKGDTLDIFPVYEETIFRIEFFGDEIENISRIDPITGEIIEKLTELAILPASHYVISDESRKNALKEIENDMVTQVAKFKSENKLLEAQRIEQRTKYDLEMLTELGVCSGIENYSRYFDGRNPGEPPFTLLDFFPDDFLMVVDESHVTIPQVRAMYGGDRSRKENLVEYGFRLPAAMDNRPLKFEEFESLQNSVIYVSATPADYELEMSEGIIVEQIIRPTGLLDPKIIIKSTKHQIDDLIDEIQEKVNLKEKVLATTLTKKMAEELSRFLNNIEIRSKYIHSDIDTIERVEIMEGLRNDEFDVLIGINLLREGLDLPEVSLVAILDADKEGFLRSHRSLTQTIGRAARHVNGIAILYADRMTKSINKTIEETNYRRKKQIEFNTKNNITPTPIIKHVKNPLTERLIKKPDLLPNDDIIDFVIPEKPKEFDKKIRELRKEMERSAKELNFKLAATFRDQIKKMKEIKSARS